MAKYTFTISHIDHTGEKYAYEFRAVSLTKRQIKNALEDANDDDPLLDPIIDIAFLGCKCNNEEVEDFDDLPVEILEEALEKHPSFRNRNANRARRR